MQGIYNYVLVTNDVSAVCSVAGMLWLQFALVLSTVRAHCLVWLFSLVPLCTFQVPCSAIF